MRTIAASTLNGRFLHLELDAPVPIEGNVTVPMATWRERMESLSWREGATGVRIGVGACEAAELHGLSRLAAVVLEYTPGPGAPQRLASQLRRLRAERHLRGILIVRGDLSDLDLTLLQQLGVDAIEPTGACAPSGTPAWRLSA